MAKEFPTELLNKYYDIAMELCNEETPMFCYCGCPAFRFHIMNCQTFATEVKSKAIQLAKAAGEVWQ